MSGILKDSRATVKYYKYVEDFDTKMGMYVELTNDTVTMPDDSVASPSEHRRLASLMAVVSGDGSSRNYLVSFITESV